MPQEENAISWANGFEHGCRICRKLGKNFFADTKHGLLIHLQKDHKVTGLPGKSTDFYCGNLNDRAFFRARFQEQDLRDEVQQDTV